MTNLGCETALAGHVHHKNHLALVARQIDVLAFNVLPFADVPAAVGARHGPSRACDRLLLIYLETIAFRAQDDLKTQQQPQS